MEIVKGNDSQAAMTFTTGSMEDKDDGEMEVDIEGSLPPSDDSTWKDTREVSSLTAKMKKATSLLQLDNSEEDSNGSDFAENDQSVHSDDLDLDLDNYDSDALEVPIVRRVRCPLHQEVRNSQDIPAHTMECGGPFSRSNAHLSRDHTQ